MRSDKSRFNDICAATSATVRTGFNPRRIIQKPPIVAIVTNNTPPTNKAKNILFVFRSNTFIGTMPRI